MNRRDKSGPKPIVATCPHCGKALPSKFQAKRHICREQPQ